MKCKGFSAPCGKYKAVKFRMRTNFIEDSHNWAILCPKCQEECRVYWNDMWDQYHH